MHGDEFSGMVPAFGSLVYFRLPRRTLKAMPKFATPAISTGWHLTPGFKFNFNGDYLDTPISAFRSTTTKKTVNAFRIKELVSFDATKFPQQTAAEEAKISASKPKETCPEVWIVEEGILGGDMDDFNVMGEVVQDVMK